MGGRPLLLAICATLATAGAAAAQPVPPAPPAPPIPPAYIEPAPGRLVPPPLGYADPNAAARSYIVPPQVRAGANRGLLSARPAELRGDDEGWSVMIGGGVLVRPAYAGSDIYEANPIPAAAIGYGDWFFADPAQGVGARHSFIPGTTASAGVTYRFGRQEDDDSRLAGLGDIGGGASAFGSVELRPFPGILRALSAEIGLEAPFTGDLEGVELTADLAVAVPIGGGGYASFSAGSVWASEAMMDQLFGITPAQAAASIFPAYDPDGGLRAWRFGASALRPLFGNVEGLVTFGYDHLTGDARKSPIVETEHQYRLGAGLLYRFGE